MGGRKLLWILLGLSLLVLVASRKTVEEETVEEDFEDEEEEEDDGCDPDCEKRCHKLKCAAGFVRDSCGCCECALNEGEYCNLTPRSKRRGRKDLKSRLLSSFLSLTPPYTFAPTTSFTNFAYEDGIATSSSSPTIYASSTVAVDSVKITNMNEKKRTQTKNQSIKHGGIYSNESNQDLGRRKKVSFYDKTVYGTCGDYLECRSLIPLPDSKEKRRGKSFKFGENMKSKTYQEAKKITVKRKKSQIIERLKKSFNFGSNWDRGGSDFNKNKNGLNQPDPNNENLVDDNKNSLLQDDINFDDYLLSLFPSSSPFLSSSPTNNINNFPWSQAPVVGTCVCRYAVTVCASNGKTYKNICHLRSASGFGEGSNSDVHVVKEGPCDPPVAVGMKPKIVSGPEFVRNVTGGSAALSCEVIGDPIPYISWLKTNVNNVTFELPGDDKDMMTLTQGGPEKHEITAWIQIMKLRKDHEGDYSCVAFNKHGKSKATGRLKVNKKGKKKRHHHKDE